MIEKLPELDTIFHEELIKIISVSFARGDFEDVSCAIRWLLFQDTTPLHFSYKIKFTPVGIMCVPV